jgi:hypothetical protein
LFDRSLHQPFEQPHRRVHYEHTRRRKSQPHIQLKIQCEKDTTKRKILLTKHARGPVPNLEEHEEDERYEKGDKGSGVDGDDVLAVLLSFR